MPDSEKLTAAATRTLITVTGVVQGVGFRPFVFREAAARGLTGRVINTSAGVEIDLEGPATEIDSFIRTLADAPPPRAVIINIDRVAAAPVGYDRFRIGTSVAARGRRRLVSPDSSTCDECLTELFDPHDRRYRYPFINCTNCGPRFTIIEALPYDRPLTTMRKFDMCPECHAEYEDPGNRRFHAEPNACPACGPSLWLADAAGMMLPTDDPVKAAAAALSQGKIVALKGLGGFQLACLATSAAVVSNLRQRKRREHKPFAVMTPSPEEAALNCRISPAEKRLLLSVERPIVLLDRLDGGNIVPDVAPGLDRLGMMLPCAPLHFLLMDSVGEPLVMTSGNLSEEPICRTNSEAIARLAGIADLFLLHDRGIVSTYDDSVVAADHRGRQMMLRRARGFAPLPVKLPDSPLGGTGLNPVLAAGGELKSSFCLARGPDAFVSQHIGDLENAETLAHYQRTGELYERLFAIQPRRLACDKHPGYLSSALALERGKESKEQVLRIQHHQAHVASCLAENGFTGAAVGAAFDGTGLGDDGAIWGGEFFAGSLVAGFARAAHLEYFPLLGGEAAIREPWRTALSLAWRHATGEIDFIAGLLDIAEEKKQLLVRQLSSGLNCPASSSCGRLFDAVAAMALGRRYVSYEAQAALELETAATRWLRRKPAPAALQSYRFSLSQKSDPWTVSPSDAVREIIASVKAGEDPARIAARFHKGLAEVIVSTCTELALRLYLEVVALSGGVWQNRLLLALVEDGLEKEGLTVITQRMLPANDGGLSLGQAAISLFAAENAQNC